MALRESRDRPIVMIAGGRRLSALYMKPALAQLARLPNVAVIPTIEEGPIPHPSIRVGRIEAHMPPLDPSDVVYACGSPRMVSALAGLVEQAGATFYADPFESAGQDAPTGLLGKLKTLVQRETLQQSGAERRPRAQVESRRGEAASQPNSFSMLEKEFVAAHMRAAGPAGAGHAAPRIAAAE
jgi:3-phenylpropionate/trans-cinnamate dioxygenase ferredoxin reductase subunit